MKAIERVWMVAAGVLGFPALAVAHGDDTVRLVSFFGPVLGLLAFMLVVSVGKAIIRRRQGA